MAELKAIIGDNLEAIVEYDLDRGQTEILFPNDAAQPGTEAEITITAVKFGDADLLDDLSQGCINRLENEAWDNENESV